MLASKKITADGKELLVRPSHGISTVSLSGDADGGTVTLEFADGVVAGTVEVPSTQTLHHGKGNVFFANVSGAGASCNIKVDVSIVL